MPIPTLFDLTLPLLKLLSDRNEHYKNDVIEMLAMKFQLTEDERKELLPSGIQTRFDNRVDWARAELKMGGLLESTGTKRFRITEQGLQVLKSNPTRIDRTFLKQFPEYLTRFSKQEVKQNEKEDAGLSQTPQEVLESSHQTLKRNLAQDLLTQVKKCSPRFFEQLVVDLLLAMGYGGSRADAGEVVGKSGDAGIDGIIKEDKLGLDFIYVQAKRWEGTVGRPFVQGFAGSLDEKRARKGVMLTTSQFSQDAKDYVGRIGKTIVLIDGEELAQLMIDHGVGVSEVATYTVKKIDLDYFDEG